MSTDTDSLSPDEAATAAHLATSLRAVAAATTPSDRRAEVVAAERRRTPPRTARWLVPVAATLLLVGAVVVAVTVQGGDGAERAGPSDPTPAPGPVDDPGLDTGWYLPAPGWTITAVDTDYLDVGEGGASCPCSAWVAARPGADPAAIGVAQSATPTDDFLEGVQQDPIDVGGRPGTQVVVDGLPDRTWVHVDQDGQRVTAVGTGVTVDEVVAVLDAWLDQLATGPEVDSEALPLPDGFVRTPLQRRTGTFETLVVVTAEDEAGAVVTYELVPTGWHRELLFTATDVEELDGAFLARGEGENGAYAAAIGGPADVAVGVDYLSPGATTLDPDERAAFAAGLHEVDAAAWRAALPDAAPDAVAADTLFSDSLAG